MATFLTKKHLSRRTLLRGGVAAVGLPFLDAMVPAGTALAQTAASPKTRAGFFYLPHGAIMNNTPFGKEVDAWTSSGSGDSFELGHILKPLEPLKSYVTTFENLENKAAAGSVHTLNPATWLSCVRPDTSLKTPNLATTLDQVIARKLGQATARARRSSTRPPTATPRRRARRRCPSPRASSTRSPTARNRRARGPARPSRPGCRRSSTRCAAARGLPRWAARVISARAPCRPRRS